MSQVIIERQGLVFLGRMLDGSGYLMSNHKPLKWLDLSFCKAALINKGFTVLTELSVYRGVSIYKGTDRQFYVTQEQNHVFRGYTIKKEDQAKQLIDWHYDNS